jgi:hypothetical protein
MKTLIITFIALLGYSIEAVGQQPEPLGNEEDQKLVAWFECETCENNELASVVALGQFAVPTLVQVLRDGPTPAKLASLHKNPGGSCDCDLLTPRDRIQLRRIYTEDLIARYSARAAIALGKIGGEIAEDALRKAARRDVREAIDSALAELGAEIHQ